MDFLKEFESEWGNLLHLIGERSLDFGGKVGWHWRMDLLYLTNQQLIRDGTEKQTCIFDPKSIRFIFWE